MTQIRIQVTNQQFALTNDRAQVLAAQAARDFAAQSLDAEQKKYRLGASTTANVLQQGRNLAVSDNTLISATAAYAKDRSLLRQLAGDDAGCLWDQYSGRGGGGHREASGDPGVDGTEGSRGTEADFDASDTPPQE